MKAKDLIIEYVDKQSISDKEELIAIMDKVETPEADELRKRYLASIISRAVATVRDADGRRCILAKRDADGTKYVNLEQCKDLNILQEIKKRLQKEIGGRNRSLKKVDLKITAVQLNMFKVIDGNKQAQ